MQSAVHHAGMVTILFAACGGNSPVTPGSGLDGGEVEAGRDSGAPVVDGSSPGGAGVGVTPAIDAPTGACANLACLKQAEALMNGCAGAGACVAFQILAATNPTTNLCYDNGVRIQATTKTVSGSGSYRVTSTYAVKKSDVLCYSRTVVNSSTPTSDAGILGQLDTTLQDAAGATVVTAHIESAGVATVTCPGGIPTVFSDSCGYSTLAVSGSYATQADPPPTCTDGSCSY